MSGFVDHNTSLMRPQLAENYLSLQSSIMCQALLVWIKLCEKLGAYPRPGFFYFSFYRPSRPNFLEIEKKIKEFFFNFIFLFPSDLCQYSTGVQLCFFVLSFLLLPG